MRVDFVAFKRENYKTFEEFAKNVLGGYPGPRLRLPDNDLINRPLG